MVIDNCIESFFLYNCTNCSYCFMCHNLTNKQYCIRNKQYTKEAYLQWQATRNLGSYKAWTTFVQEREDMVNQSIHKQDVATSEKVSGNFLEYCKNVQVSFNVLDAHDCKYCYDTWNLRDCYDTYESAFDCSLQYECHACNRGTSILAGHVSYDVNHCQYIDCCHNASFLFGCIGLRNKQYCICNKQYTEKEFETLTAKIIQHMQKTGEWGEFFPTHHSPFAYNESVAQDEMPLSWEEVQRRWLSRKNDDDKSIWWDSWEVETLPDHIQDTTEEVEQKPIKCRVTGKLFKIIPQEYALYKQLWVPLPRIHPNQRYKERLEKKWVNNLYLRTCSQTGKQILSIYAQDVPFPVYSEDAYRQEVFG